VALYQLRIGMAAAAGINHIGGVHQRVAVIGGQDLMAAVAVHAGGHIQPRAYQQQPMDTGGVLGPFALMTDAAGLFLGKDGQNALFHVLVQVHAGVAGFAVEVLVHRHFDGNLVAVKTRTFLRP